MILTYFKIIFIYIILYAQSILYIHIFKKFYLFKIHFFTPRGPHQWFHWIFLYYIICISFDLLHQNKVYFIFDTHNLLKKNKNKIYWNLLMVRIYRINKSFSCCCICTSYHRNRWHCFWCRICDLPTHEKKSNEQAEKSPNQGSLKIRKNKNLFYLI